MDVEEKNVVISKTIDDFDITLETFDKKPDDFSCIICMYETDDNDIEMEKILKKKSINDEIGRYCMIKTSYSYLCDHSFHTACIHEWFITSKNIKCPLCQQELSIHNVDDPIRKIYVGEPKFVRTTYDFANGATKICEEYYTIDDKKHGSYKNYSIMGYLCKECTYIDGLKDGLEFEYFQNGRMKSMHRYSKGMKNGKFWVKTQEGWYIIKGEYKNNKFNGMIRRWDEKSRTLIFGCKYLNGKKHGAEMTWFEPTLISTMDVSQVGLMNTSPMPPKVVRKYKYPQLKSYSMYNNNVLDGFVLMYSYNGILIKKAHYKKGILHGRYIENYNCGSKKCERVYFMGNIIGVSKQWYLPDENLTQDYNQQLSQLEMYALDASGIWKKDGIWKQWYRNGSIKRYMPYLFGKLHGRAIYLNENGNPIEVGNYKNGKPHGEYYLYYNKLSLLKDNESPKLHWVMQFNDGNLHGKCIEYNTRGLNKLELKYKNGQLETMLT